MGRKDVGGVVVREEEEEVVVRCGGDGEVDGKTSGVASLLLFVSDVVLHHSQC